MFERITTSPDVCHGKPVIKGTRVMVYNIFGALSGGYSIEMILEDYPSVTLEDIYEALAYGAAVCNRPISFP